MPFFEQGDLVKGQNGKVYVVAKATPYEARAHNDRWTDRHYDLRLITRAGTVSKTAKPLYVSTHDAMRGVDKVGHVEVTFGIAPVSIRP